MTQYTQNTGHFFRSLMVFLSLLSFIPTANSAPIDSGNVKAELLSEYKSVAPGQTVTVLLSTVIREEWHTYWQNPGDSGAPTTLDWQLPEGFEAGEIQWPYPKRLPYGPLINFGYEGQVLFPVEITVPDDQASGLVVINAEGGWLVCADICIPEDASLSLELNVGESILDESLSDLFSTARQKLPRSLDIPSTFSVVDTDIKLAIQMAGLRRDRIKEVSYFPYKEGLIENSAEQALNLSDVGFELQTLTGYDYTVDSSFDGIVVITEDAGEMITTAFEIKPLSGIAKQGMSLMSALLFAFLGGLILNLMPCVFPVLSIKILSLMKETDHVRSHGWVYLAGVVLSFVAVAAVLIGLRAGGAEIGWGFQLQSPLVVALLAYLFLLIGLNLSGYFEIGAGVMNIGQGLTQNGYIGSFMTGVLATVVAAPCTAPFMASAIGFALTQSNFNALLIFAFLGLGMAVPYVLLCHSPYLLKKMPKPGVWMENAKELLAFPLYGSAIWLAWVLSVQSGSSGVLYWGVGALSIVFAIWLLKHLPRQRVARLIFQFFALSLIGAAIYLPTQLEAGQGNTQSNIDSDGGQAHLWEAYSEEKLAEYRAKGPVFVDFDAAWCITCKVNESVAIDTEEVRNAFEKYGVHYLKGDWTNEDPMITKKLAEYDRSGVPLYLLYKNSDTSAVVLPQILTKNIIISALDKTLNAQ